MKKEIKVVVAGPVGVGKTTAISSLAEGGFVSTQAKATDMTANRKELTTVAMDYGVFHLDVNTHIHLYGTPGQERFSFMWDILSIGAAGLVLLIDATRSHPKKDMHFFLTTFRKLAIQSPVVIGICRMNEYPELQLTHFREMLSEVCVDLGIPGFNPVMHKTDSRSATDMRQLITALFHG